MKRSWHSLPGHERRAAANVGLGLLSVQVSLRDGAPGPSLGCCQDACGPAGTLPRLTAARTATGCRAVAGSDAGGCGALDEVTALPAYAGESGPLTVSSVNSTLISHYEREIHYLK
jgi:hypothetical protein